MIRGGVYGFVAVSNTILGYFIFITLVATEGPESLVFDNLFITISLLITLRLFVIEYSVLALQRGTETVVALSRIQVYNMISNSFQYSYDTNVTAEAVDIGQCAFLCH